MSNYKMKGLFKGLRFISQIFENEKEPEMQIGTPTDVKHVAHIGWDGGSVDQNPPSWMNDFKVSGGYSSAPLGNIKEDVSCISEDSTRSRDTPAGLPKSSRERSSTLGGGSPAKEQRSRRGSSHSSSGNPKSSRRSKESSDQDIGSRKSRRKKSKDSSSVNGGSSRSSRRARGSQTESVNGSIVSDEGSMISIDLH
ncbi:PREDICTED: CRIB domain-containing protein RIC8-like [Camelina sativa]|uniref:CRIB domain-containing protein RIC8-like n=1 Tax=Camelina sativa TaxID=90675 RepID=A0ABM0VK39_CAMSA|nr:PREDICTED: CRIB domain-containing protein RIC8-like [Camelina sativa]